MHTEVNIQADIQMPIDTHMQVDGYQAGIGSPMHTEVCLQVYIQILIVMIDSPVDCVRLVIQKDVDKVMIDLNTEGFAASVNAIERFAAWKKSFEFY